MIFVRPIRSTLFYCVGCLPFLSYSFHLPLFCHPVQLFSCYCNVYKRVDENVSHQWLFAQLRGYQSWSTFSVPQRCEVAVGKCMLIFEYFWGFGRFFGFVEHFQEFPECSLTALENSKKNPDLVRSSCMPGRGHRIDRVSGLARFFIWSFELCNLRPTMADSVDLNLAKSKRPLWNGLS